MEANTSVATTNGIQVSSNMLPTSYLPPRKNEPNFIHHEKRFIIMLFMTI